ncbi:MAG: sugar kinase [Candidatus Edwardsbacteria bacterium]|nr:sugar kinase [Candidatus Edwardsbacteria bacterium]MBU1576248.1 sugar kinase [Candidatus Edwardsbacteria bacterium]MBU2462583.1 sugar kinase [Candidatus Edwardsbacteria bacterium]MBU2594337.1 sugar kinase [Candidatus Edwardsbacteria bacterium]
MAMLVVGSIALDSVKTPFGEAKEALGGSALYFSSAASFFTQVSLVGVVGEDFPRDNIEFLAKRGVDLSGLEVVKGKTFRWAGSYEHDMNEAKTHATDLNVFEGFRPKLKPEHENTEFLFLANIDPILQQDVIAKVKGPKAIGCDTMNFWIGGKRDELLKTIKKVDIMFINDAEARQLAGVPNLFKAAKAIREMGPKILVIKKGEHGAMLLTDNTVFSVPAYPLEDVFDPTGAGDSFAGGFMGYLSSKGEINDYNLRRAMVYGSVMASFNVESFSMERLKTLTREEIEKRFKEFKKLSHFEETEV